MVPPDQTCTPSWTLSSCCWKSRKSPRESSSLTCAAVGRLAGCSGLREVWLGAPAPPCCWARALIGPPASGLGSPPASATLYETGKPTWCDQEDVQSHHGRVTVGSKSLSESSK